MRFGGICTDGFLGLSERGILGPRPFRPGPPRILRTLDVAHKISSVSRGLAPFPKVFQILPD
jgi:hypothetical protein